MEQGQVQLNAITRRLAEVFPENRKWNAATAIPLHEVIVGSVHTGLFVLLAAVMLVLLITCVNLASLVLARVLVRDREFAVRAALGAGRGRVMQQLLTESTVLALLGGTLGIGVAYLGTKLLVSLSAGQVTGVEGVRIDLPVLVFLFGVSILTGLLFGLIPAIRISAPTLHIALREGGRGVTGRLGARVRGALVVAQVAISVVLVVGAALMTQSFVRQMRVDLGFKPDQVVAVSFTIGESYTGTDEKITNHIRALLDQVRATPGVTAAGATKALPFRGNGEPAMLTIQGAANTVGGFSTVMLMHVTDGYFATMGIPVLAGREYRAGDGGRPTRSELPVVVSRSLGRCTPSG